VHPLDRLGEDSPSRVCRIEVAKQRLLELVAVLDIRAVPQLLNKGCQDGLRGQVPRMAQHLIRPLIQDAHKLQCPPQLTLARCD